MGYLSKIIPPKLKRYQFLECKNNFLTSQKGPRHIKTFKNYTMGYLSKIIPPKLKRYQFLECKKSLLEY